ncbi:MAG: PQQ-binding-like beta-propeller repeat protein [Fimbriimonadaceae bacterium]|nr:PQQ-binding-like beta-propeller repeat protein [Fimbriimonadaceae bacterium]
MSRLTRRDVLRAGAGLALAPALGRLARSSSGAESFDFAYFSDTHVSLQRNAAECAKMMAEMLGFFRPAFAINGGDVTDYGWAGEYDTYDKVLGGFGVKTHHVPGNHDVRWSPLGLKIFQDRVGVPFKSFDHQGVHFVLLDSTVPLSHWGHYESAQLRWLEEDLKKVGRATPVIVTTHHWVGREAEMIDNERALLAVIEPYNVPMILTGHGHGDLLWDWEGHLCTMNKGLYQGSYQRVEVDFAKSEVRLSRRTTDRPEPTLLASASLKPAVEKRPVWALGVAAIAKGRPLRVTIPEAKEARWNGEPYAPIVNGQVATVALLPGDNRLSLRDPASKQERTFIVSVVEPEGRLIPKWNRKLPGGVMSHLCLAGGTLYASAMDGSVLALEPKTGRVLWTAKTGGYCHSSPAVHEGLLVVGSADGNAYGFDAKTGKERWRFATQGPVYASAAFAKGVVAIASGDGQVYGINPTTGKPVWTYALPKSNTAFVQSPAATDGERFYLGAWDNYLYALDAKTGGLAWRSICCERTFAFSPAIGGPAVADGRVVVPANGNVLYCFDAKTGKSIWEYASPGDKVGYSGPTIADGRIYIGCLGDIGQARCIGLDDGKEVWCATPGKVIYDSTPSVADGLVAVGSVAALLSVFDQKDGSIFAQYRMPAGHFLSSPVARDGWIWAATYSDYVYGFEVRR